MQTRKTKCFIFGQLSVSPFNQGLHSHDKSSAHALDATLVQPSFSAVLVAKTSKPVLNAKRFANLVFKQLMD